MIRLLLARHGESEWQVVGDQAGPDSELTELGRRQADRLGRWLAENIPVDHVYASPLRRAHDTAQQVAAHLDLPVRVHEDLMESWFAVSPTLPTFSTPVETLHVASVSGLPVDSDYRLFRSQVATALQDILGYHDRGTLLIVAHGGTIGTIFRVLLGSETFTIHVGNTTVHSVVWNGDRWHVEYTDRWEHLAGL